MRYIKLCRTYDDNNNTLYEQHILWNTFSDSLRRHPRTQYIHNISFSAWWHRLGILVVSSVIRSERWNSASEECVNAVLYATKFYNMFDRVEHTVCYPMYIVWYFVPQEQIIQRVCDISSRKTIIRYREFGRPPRPSIPSETEDSEGLAGLQTLCTIRNRWYRGFAVSQSSLHSRLVRNYGRSILGNPLYHYYL